MTDVPSLDESELDRWSAIQERVPELASPFLAPQFAQAVAAARDDVRTAVLLDGGAPVGFFAFQRGRTGLGRPVGGKLSDQQGVVVPPRADWNLVELLKAVGLRSYSFDHAVPVHSQLAPFISKVEESPVLDLSDGYEAYRERARAERLGAPREAEAKKRRLERRIGQVRFTWDERDPAVLRKMLAWKSSQYARTTGFDPISLPWVREVIERVHSTREPTFEGILSCLRVEERPLAISLCLRSRDLLAGWQTAYDVELARHSPGLVLQLMLIEAAAADGVRLLDFGKGQEGYKRRFTREASHVAVGSVAIGKVATLGSRATRASWSAVLHSPLYHRAHRLRRRLQFR